MVERTGNDLVVVGISKLKGLGICDIDKIRKEEGLTWHTLRQALIENYSNIPYMSDTMVTYTYSMQQDNECTSQYLIRAKVLLEHMKHISKLFQISGKGLNSLALVGGLRDCHIRWRVTKKQESWITMKDVYKSIDKITKTDACTKAYHEPRYSSIYEETTERIKVRDNIHVTSPVIALISGNNIAAVHTIGTKAIHTPNKFPRKYSVTTAMMSTTLMSVKSQKKGQG